MQNFSKQENIVDLATNTKKGCKYNIPVKSTSKFYISIYMSKNCESNVLKVFLRKKISLLERTYNTMEKMLIE